MTNHTDTFTYTPAPTYTSAPAPTVFDYRREHLRNLIAQHGGPAALGVKLGYTNGSFLVQMAGPAPERQVTESTCTNFEKILGLEIGSMSRPIAVPEGTISAPDHKRRRNTTYTLTAPTSAPAPAPTSAPAHADQIRLSNDQLADLIALVGDICQSEDAASLPIPKFADIVMLALLDTQDHGNVPRPSTIKRLVKLAKA